MYNIYNQVLCIQIQHMKEILSPAFADTYKKVNEDIQSCLTRNKHKHIILYYY